MVKRYEEASKDMYLVEDPGGSYVEAADYDQLEAEITHLENAKAEWKQTAERLEAENRHLRVKLAADDGHFLAHHEKIAELEKKLRDEDNACQEWRVIAEGLEKKLEEADKLSSAISHDCNHTALERNSYRDRALKAEAELACLRDAVPGEVEGLLDKYWTIGFEEGKLNKSLGSKAQYVLNDLRTLIGSLITTERERLRWMLEEAWIDGHMAYPPSDRLREAKAYAERKMKETKT